MTEINRAFGLQMTQGATIRGFSSLRKWFRVGAVTGCILGDGLAITAAAVLATFARFQDLEAGNTRDLALIILTGYFLGALVFRAYRLGALTSFIHSVSRALLSLLVAIAMTATAAFSFKVGAEYSRLESGYMVAFAALTIFCWRMMLALGLSQFYSFIKPNVALLTDGPSQSAFGGAELVLNVRNLSWTPAPDDPQFLDELFRKLKSFDRVVLSFSESASRSLWVEVMERTGLEAEVLEPQFVKRRLLGLGRFEGMTTLVISRGPLSLGERVSKRLVDLAAVLGLAPVLLPLFFLIAAAIKVESSGPILFVQRRVGRNNRQFNCYKFRTMKHGSEDREGTRSASRDDERLTRIGRLLRRTSFDELPQLWNVLIGEMSLVGPRPHALGSTAEGQLFWQIAQGYWLRHAIKPGMTGLAQVRGFRGPTHSREEVINRLASDLEYVNNWSLWLDIKILLRTPTVLVHSKAY